MSEFTLGVNMTLGDFVVSVINIKYVYISVPSGQYTIFLSALKTAYFIHTALSLANGYALYLISGR